MTSLKKHHCTEHMAETPRSMPKTKCQVNQSLPFHLAEASEKVTLFP